MAYNLRTGLIGSGDIDVNVSLSNLNAANITSGTFDLARIPTLGNSMMSAAGKRKGKAGGGGTKKKAALEQVQKDFTELVGPLPGGP